MGSLPRPAETFDAGHFSGLWRRRHLRRCSSSARVEPTHGACTDLAGGPPMAGVAGAMEKISPPPCPCRPARAKTSRLIVPWSRAWSRPGLESVEIGRDTDGYVGTDAGSLARRGVDLLSAHWWSRFRRRNLEFF